MFSRSRPHKDREKDDREKLKKLRSTEEKKRRKRSKGTEELKMGDSDPGSGSRRRHHIEGRDDDLVNDARSSRGSLPYPSFSKAHSKESVLPQEKINPAEMTPDATEVGDNTVKERNVGHAPPSPPLTGVEETRTQKSHVSKASTIQTTGTNETQTSAQTARRDNELKPSSRASVLSNSTLFSDGGGSIIDSEATSRARGDSESTSKARGTGSRLLEEEREPATPTQTPLSFIDPEPQVGLDIHFDAMSPRPPPPPPPPFIPRNIPRVDYLLHNGGLPHSITRTLLGAAQSQPKYFPTGQEYPSYIPTRTPAPPSTDIDKIFSAYHGVLDNYGTVLLKNGSLAVATGYKSVARRLLDRLENVFARDISSQCHCTMCSDDMEKVGWGEVLEWVGGRRELPPWPAFDFGIDTDVLGLKPQKRTKTPLQQNIDSDVPDEYRNHYLRQSAKTKKTVDKWLMAQPESATSPPQEVDDETLTFAILTHLDQADRKVFTTFLSPPRETRAPTPGNTRPPFLVRSGLALQRLYRLPDPPRDPETAIYLFKHPELHNVVSTLAAINASEWDVLTSGRFDGFLWSGAEDVDKAPSRVPSRLASRSASRLAGKPLNLAHLAASRGPTPIQAPGPGPVPYDEETEVAVLAEIEREIYVGMEALEDAFEALHRKAESIRQRLRERGAGLSNATTGGPGVEVVAGTPDPNSFAWATSETDDESDCDDWKGIVGIDSSLSELAPDDSASNISSSRHRRPKRRNERRTPAPVEEDLDEDEH
jgi:hypothetical protein